MAFRTNKVPAIEERTVSGSSVSFNSAFALPLKACKVSFSATQAGSGTKSPSNPYTISGVSGLNLSANSVPVSVNFGDTYYGGYADLVGKKGFITHGYKVFDGTENWSVTSSGYYRLFTSTIANLGTVVSDTDQISNIFDYAMITSSNTNVGFRVYSSSGYNADVIAVRPSGVNNMSKEDFIDLLTNQNLIIVYKLANPIEIDLTSIPDLSSIIGNNTFSTDTGTLEITFADLQEKSASGAVASFNTALAMPLASCNIAVNAWQEGSGDPSPVNNRPIHGFSEVNATRAGKNLFGGMYGNRFNLFIPKNTAFTVSTANTSANTYIMLYDKNGDSITQYAITNIDSTTNRKYNNIPNTINVDIYQVRFFNSSSGDYQISYSSDTAYEPYVTPTIYTIQLGQEVYGADIDVVNGVATITHRIVTLDGSSDEYWFNYSAGNGYYITLSDMDILNNGDVICNWLNKYSGVSNLGIRLGFNNNVVYVYQVNTISGVSDLTSWADYLSNNPLEVFYPLATPIEISLSDIPTLSTIIGNNSFASDSGSIELKYKDLDIAKRGNFREVFKLPS